MTFSVVAGGLLWASYTVAVRAWRAESLHATALVSVISMVLFVPAYGIATGFRIAAQAPADVLFYGLFQDLFAAILALLFYTRSVAILGAGRGAVFAGLVPAVAVMLAFPVLGERPGTLEMLGVAVVSFGMGTALGHYPLARRS
ncbi:MAG: EamA family transporter [Magnetovibrio sp.]|nr:EamA family transporter [Magnetovibrio sp.]